MSLFYGTVVSLLGQGAQAVQTEPRLRSTATQTGQAEDLGGYCESIGYTTADAYTTCFSYTALKFISIAIISAALIVKVPQLFKIWRNGSVKGLSKLSAYSELMSYFNTMAYARHLKLGLSIYGETIAISTQNLIVVLAIFWYDRKVPLHEKILFIGSFLLYATLLLADQNLTDQHWHLISSSVILCSAVARGTQFCENWRNNSTGQVAGGTLFLTFFISFCRTMTVLVQSDDFMYQLQYLFGLFNVCALGLQFIDMNYCRKVKKTSYSQSRSSASRSGSPITRRSRSRSPRKEGRQSKRSRSPQRKSRPTATQRRASPLKRSPSASPSRGRSPTRGRSPSPTATIRRARTRN